MGIEVDAGALEDFLSAWDALSEGGLMQAAAGALGHALEGVVSDARSNAPKDTGALAGSIQKEVRTAGGAVTGRVFVRAEYGLMVELGTGPKGEASHAGISPAVSQTVTYSPKGWSYPDAQGAWRYTRGQPARPYLYPAWKAKREAVREAVRRAVLREIGGKEGGTW